MSDILSQKCQPSSKKLKSRSFLKLFYFFWENLGNSREEGTLKKFNLI